MPQTKTKTCQNCKQNFIIEPDDFAFYEKMQVPPPTFCYFCRLQRRLAWRNEWGFHRRTCDLCGKNMIAIYPAGTIFPVYCRECWFSDKWDARDYGREYDFSKPFFHQFKELLDAVPRLGLQVANCVNCEYTSQIVDCKNCYLMCASGWAEDSMYSYRVIHGREIFDSFLIFDCERCYGSAECEKSSDILFSENVLDSLNLLFCADVRGGSHCFMSTNLRRASYVFRGERLTKEEYERRMKKVDLGSYWALKELKKEYQALTERAIYRYANLKNCVNTTGHALVRAKDCFWCFNSSNQENCRYCMFVDESKDCMDVNNSGHNTELAYEVSSVGVKCANVVFCVDVWPEVRDVWYSESCKSGASALFGCIGLRGQKYCILNKQYEKKSFDKMRTEIISQMDKMPYMDKRGLIYRFGEFFPTELSPIGYNESMAQDYFPLKKDEALARGYSWQEDDRRTYSITLRTEDIPDHIYDVSDDIVSQTIECAHRGECMEKCTTAFRMTSEELRIYRKINIALPRLCPNCRYYERFARHAAFRLFHRKCGCSLSGHSHGNISCQNEFETPYAPDRPEIIYCEQCYQQEVA